MSLILARNTAGKQCDNNDYEDQDFVDGKPFPKPGTFKYGTSAKDRHKRSEMPEHPSLESVEDEYRDEDAFNFVFRGLTNGKLLPDEDEGHSIQKIFVSLALLAIGSLITIVGTTIGADILVRAEAEQVAKRVLAKMEEADMTQLQNAQQIADVTDRLRKTVQEHTNE